MIKRILAAAVRWAIKPELDAVRQDVSELKRSFGKQLLEIGLRLERDDVPLERITILYFVVYEYTHNPTGHINGGRIPGCGSTSIKVDSGGIQDFTTVQRVTQHIMNDLALEAKLNQPIVRISNYIEMRRWLTEPDNGKEAPTI
jgi:hypothetical protein